MNRNVGSVQSFCLLGMVASLLILATNTASASTIAYNLRDDFSTTQNPNGVWSYNLGGTPITGTLSGSAGDGWGYMTSWDGCIIKTTSTATSCHDWQQGDILVHAYSFGGDNSITWTSPSAGTIGISGLAWDANFESGRDANWTLMVNGAVVASCSTIYGTFRTDAVALFASNLAAGKSLTDIVVASGDIVEFTTQKMNSYGEFVGVDMNITLTSVPEPSALVLLGVGIASLTFAWRRNRRFS